MRTLKGSLFVAGVLALGMIGPVAAESRTWAERTYKAKYGRPSPMEEARLQADRASTAFRQGTVSPAEPAGQAWMKQYFKAKHGRNTPAEEARLKAERENTAYREAPAGPPAPINWVDRYKAKYGRAPGR
jgi:hypothetical protein